MKQNIDISELLGKSIDADTLNLLMTEGRIKFPTKPVTGPSAISNGLDTESCEKSLDLKNKDAILKDLVDNVKENEKLVKTLEDMRDDLIRDMAIPGSSAANVLGATNGVITKEIYDKAKTITDPDFVAISTWGYVPKLAALLGDGRILGKYTGCAEVTKAVFDGFTLAKKDIANNTVTTFNEDSTIKAIDQTEKSFENKMLEMAAFILNKLFWNHIWTRMWVGIFDMVAKLIAKPIDTPILIFKSLLHSEPYYKLSTENYYKFGPIHKLLNRVKKLFLCVIPKTHWKPYMPEVGVEVFVNGRGMVSIAEICLDKYLDECKDKIQDIVDAKAKNEDIKEFEELSKIKQATDNIFPDGIDECPESDLKAAFEKVGTGTNSVGTDIDCLAAANKVLRQVYNDTMFNN